MSDLNVEIDEGDSSLMEPDKIKIYVGNEEIFSFNDNLYEHPEDATWSRFLNTLFFKGVEAGKKLSENQDGGGS